jgi:hypothetical protein
MPAAVKAGIWASGKARTGGCFCGGRALVGRTQRQAAGAGPAGLRRGLEGFWSVCLRWWRRPGGRRVAPWRANLGRCQVRAIVTPDGARRVGWRVAAAGFALDAGGRWDRILAGTRTLPHCSSPLYPAAARS